MQELAAAEGPSAGAEAAEHTGFVAHADLPELDAHPENGSEALYQLTEIHALRRGIEEQDLGAVEGVFHLHEAHIELILLDLLAAYLIGARLFFFVALQRFKIFGGGNAHDALQRLYDLLVRHAAVRRGADAALHPAHRFHDHLLILLHAVARGIEIIDLSGFFEFYSDNFSHSIFHLYLYICSGCAGRGGYPLFAISQSREENSVCSRFSFALEAAYRASCSSVSFSA